MVLLHLLHELGTVHGWRLTVAHFNHQLRGRSSDADEQLVRRTAKKLGLPWVRGSADVRQAARKQRVSVEMAARRLRHDFLARAAARRKIRAIALAHHADDQIELFFLRLFRGTGSEGLGGMKWRAPSPATGRRPAPSRRSQPLLQPELVRPLLGVAKADLEAFARKHKVPFREDASNARLDIQRNRIRHELLPLLRRKYQPALERTVTRLMEIAGAESDLITRLASEWWKRKRRVSLAKLPVAVQRRCLQLQLLKHGLPAEYELVERLRLFPGRKITLSPRHTAVFTLRGGLRLQATSAERASGFRRFGPKDRLKLDLQAGRGRGRIAFGGLKISWRIDARRAAVVPKPRFGREEFDADRVGARLVLRHWVPGDRFQPIGMPTPVKLQDLFTNLKIPQAERHTLVVLSKEGGELVWVERVRISERFKLRRGTVRKLKWEWKRL